MCAPDGGPCEGPGSLFDQILTSIVGHVSATTYAFLQGIFSGIIGNHNETVLTDA